MTGMHPMGRRRYTPSRRKYICTKWMAEDIHSVDGRNTSSYVRREYQCQPIEEVSNSVSKFVDSHAGISLKASI